MTPTPSLLAEPSRPIAMAILVDVELIEQVRRTVLRTDLFEEGTLTPTTLGKVAALDGPGLGLVFLHITLSTCQPLQRAHHCFSALIILSSSWTLLLPSVCYYTSFLVLFL